MNGNSPSNFSAEWSEGMVKVSGQNLKHLCFRDPFRELQLLLKLPRVLCGYDRFSWKSLQNFSSMCDLCPGQDEVLSGGYCVFFLFVIFVTVL
jgi:hypothetical protein